MSVASAVGFIALGGVAAEIGVVMLVYVNEAVATRVAQGRLHDVHDLALAIVEGAHCVCAYCHDRRRDHCRPVAYHVGVGHRIGSDAPHRRTDGGWDGHRAAAVDVRATCGLLAHAAAQARRRGLAAPEWKQEPQLRGSSD